MSGPSRLVYRLDLVLLVGLLIAATLVVLPLLIGHTVEESGIALFHSPVPTEFPTVAPSATWTHTPTATTTASPTVTPSNTVTASPTVTPSATLTPSATMTPSFTPSTTPTHTPPPTVTPEPLATPRVEPLNIVDLYAGVNVTVRGEGLPGSTIVLYDNDWRLATARASAAGTWQIVVPGLSVGEHRLVVVAISEDARMSDAAPVGFLIVHAPTATGLADSMTLLSSSDTPQSAAALPSATPTALPLTATPVVTRVPPSATATATVTASATSTLTQTPAPTATLTPSETPTATATPTPTYTLTPSPTPTPLPLMIIEPETGASVPAGAAAIGGQGPIGGYVVLVDSDGMVRGAAVVDRAGQWMLDADLSGLQGDVILTALVQDETGAVLEQSDGVPVVVVAQLAPPTGAELPSQDDASDLQSALALTVIVGLALLVGGLVLRQAGVVVRLGERQDD